MSEKKIQELKIMKKKIDNLLLDYQEKLDQLNDHEKEIYFENYKSIYSLDGLIYELIMSL